MSDRADTKDDLEIKIDDRTESYALLVNHIGFEEEGIDDPNEERYREVMNEAGYNPDDLEDAREYVDELEEEFSEELEWFPLKYD